MRIFISGASGYIGRAVAAACSRAGHNVLGLVRSREKAASLESIEIEPVLGSMEDPSTYVESARECDAIIHCAAEMSARFWELDRLTIETLLSAASQAGAPRKLIFTSGVWVYGDTGSRMVNESTRLNPPAFVSRRPEHEQLVMSANGNGLQSIVIRPGCVYGGPGGLTAAWFESATRDKAARIIGDGSARWSMIHLHDLADFYLRAVESAWGGEVFNATDRSRFTVLECARAASEVAGQGGKVVSVPAEEARAMMGPVADCLSMSQHVDSRKAVRMLNWQPRHGGFVDGVGRYYAAWKAQRPA